MVEAPQRLSDLRADRVFDEPLPPPPAPRLAVLKAFLWLAYVDAELQVRGYAFLRRRLRKYTVVRARPAHTDMQAEVLAAVDRASVYYPRQAKCLLRSVVATCLLRKNGVPAQMVIGCRHTPFYAHAWVEVDGIVVNDQDKVKSLYPEIERV
jgi:hypothetical protein